jgi:hypothetical protein
MSLLGVIKGPLTFLRSERPARDRLSPRRDGSLDVQAHRGPGCRSWTPSARASPGGASRSSGVDSRTEERPRLSRPESRPLRMSSTFSTPTWPLAASPLQVRPADHHGASTERDGLDHVAAHPEPPSSTISTSPPTASAMAGSVRTDAGAAVLGRLRERVQLTRGQRQAVPILARPRQGAKLIPGRVRWRAARPGMADRTLRRRRSRRNLNRPTARRGPASRSGEERDRSDSMRQLGPGVREQGCARASTHRPWGRPRLMTGVRAAFKPSGLASAECSRRPWRAATLQHRC